MCSPPMRHWDGRAPCGDGGPLVLSHQRPRTSLVDVQMREAAFVLSHATNTSLVLIDELGRG